MEQTFIMYIESKPSKALTVFWWMFLVSQQREVMERRAQEAETADVSESLRQPFQDKRWIEIPDIYQF